MSRRIPLTQDREAIVDAEDAEYVGSFTWYYHQGYARRGQWIPGENITIQLAMHHKILGIEASRQQDVDHINGNGLDNRKSNLRIVTRQQNSYNMKPHRGSSSRYKGVHWDKTREKWHAQIGLNGRSTHIGRYDCEVEAAEAYNQAARIHFKEHAWLNEIT